MTYGRANRSTRSTSRFIDVSHAEELAGGVEDLLVHFESTPLTRKSLDAGPSHRPNELGDIRESGLRGGGPTDGDRFVGLSRSRLFRPRNHCSDRTAAAGSARGFAARLGAESHAQ